LKKNLILTGMMGVGKTTIGKALSERLKIKFLKKKAKYSSEKLKKLLL